MNSPLVSVCLITYNHKEFIEKAIDSVLMQKVNFDWELVIADDYSTDGTREIIAEYKNRYPNFIKLILQEKNVGPTPNWLKLIKTPNCKYIAYLDGDDYWKDPYKIQKQVEFLEGNEEFSMCFTNSTIVDQNENIIKSSRVDEKNKKNTNQADILQGFVPPTNTVLYRNKYLQEIVACFPEITNGDYYVSVNMANYGPIGYLDSITAAYRIHPAGSWSNRDDDSRRIQYVKTLLSLRGKVQKQNEQFLENQIIANLNAVNELNKTDKFLDNNYWTPQTAMLRAIRDTVVQIDGDPKAALSIDKNPDLEKILLRKWPEINMTVTSWPEYDAQNLNQFKNDTFDIVFSSQILEHIPKPWIAAKEMVRVLKKGGIGIHTSCAYNPRKGYPSYKDYYRFLPDGLAELFEDVDIWIKDGWGSKQALIYNLAVNDGNGALGGRRFVEAMALENDINYPWHTWVIFQKK